MTYSCGQIVTVDRISTFRHNTWQRKWKRRVHSHCLEADSVQVSQIHGRFGVDLVVGLEGITDFRLQLGTDLGFPHQIIGDARQCGRRGFAAGSHKIGRVGGDLKIGDVVGGTTCEHASEEVWPIDMLTDSSRLGLVRFLPSRNDRSWCLLHHKTDGICLMGPRVLHKPVDGARHQKLEEPRQGGKSIEGVCESTLAKSLGNKLDPRVKFC